VQPDGKILLVGDINEYLDAGVVRLDPDGSTDMAFGTSGVAVIDARGNDDGAAVSLDSHGRILVAGDEGASAGFVARLVGQSDSDGDGVPDVSDACPATAAATPTGCPVAPRPEAVLKGKKVVLDTVLTKTKASAACPKKAAVAVKTKGSKGPIKVVRKLKVKADPLGCRVKGKVKLLAKPKKTAKVKVTVSGKKVRTRHLVAVRG
jgi:hypothetical protein